MQWINFFKCYNFMEIYKNSTSNCREAFLFSTKVQYICCWFEVKWFNVFQIWLIHSQNVNIILLFLSNWVSTPLPWLFFLRWDLYIPSKVDCLTSQWRICEIVVTFEWWFQCDIFYQTRPSLLLYENRNVTIKNTSFPWRSLLLAVNTVVVRIWTRKTPQRLTVASRGIEKEKKLPYERRTLTKGHCFALTN